MAEATLDGIFKAVMATQKDVIATQKDVIATQKDVVSTQKDVQKLASRFDALNGTVHQTREEIAVLKDWRESQVAPAVESVADLRVEVAKAAGIGGSIGAVLGIVLLIGKAIGVF